MIIFTIIVRGINENVIERNKSFYVINVYVPYSMI